MGFVASGPFLGKHINNVLRIQTGCLQRLRALPQTCTSLCVIERSEASHGKRKREGGDSISNTYTAHTHTGGGGWLACL